MTYNIDHPSALEWLAYIGSVAAMAILFVKILVSG
jgi:hypothetical protein